MRTQKREESVKHLKNSKETFLKLLKVVRNIDKKTWQSYITKRDYEGLEMFILENLLK